MGKRILVMSLAICFVLATVLSVSAATTTDSNAKTITKLDNGAVMQQYTAIAKYRVNTPSEPGTPKGYSDYKFAGWYADENGVNPLDKTGADNAKSAYAKFVPKEILSVRVQITAGTTYKSETTNMRFTTSVDTLNYEYVGFECVLNGVKKTAQTDTVYRELFAAFLEEDDAEKKIDTLKPAAFSTMSKYFMACVMKNIPNADFGDMIEVKPYWVTVDGTKVYGETNYKTVNMGYMENSAVVTASEVFNFSNIGEHATLEKGLSSYSMQGGCTDGTYYYQALVYQVDSSSASVDDHVYIIKYTMPGVGEDGEEIPAQYVGISNKLTLRHANDITYNSDLDQLIVSHNAPENTKISFVDPGNLGIVETKTLPYSIYSIEYNAYNDKYVVGISGDYTYRILNADFTDVSTSGKAFSPNPEVNGFVRQGVSADDKYIYFVLYNSQNAVTGYDNVIAVYDWDGNAVNVLNIASASIPTTVEPENITIYDNEMYIAGHNKVVYKATNISVLARTPEASIERGGEAVKYDTLELAVEDVQEGETITVLNKKVSVSETMELNLANVTITNKEGLNVKIKRGADHSGILLDNHASGLKIQSNTSGSLTFVGNGYVGSSYVYNNKDATLTLTDVTFKNIESNESGAAVYATAGTVTVSNCSFDGNTAREEGGAIATAKTGITTTIENSVFENNASTSYGGAISNYGTKGLTITDCTFDGNNAGNNGGAIYHANGGKITLTDNDTDVAAIFENNESGGNGGAICIGSGTLEVTGYDFVGNSAYRGGAIRLNSQDIEATLSGSAFKKNTAPINGGAISNASTFVDADKMALTISDCVFGAENEGNSSDDRGGAIYNSGTSIRVTDTAFANNTAVYGGAINNEGSKLIATSCHFTSNESTATDTSKLTGRGGGAVNVVGNSTATFNGTGTFTRNTATNGWGGAIYMTDSKLAIIGYTFEENSADYAGAILIDNVYDSSIAGETGETSTITISNSNFASNEAGTSGGAIFVKKNLTVSDSTFDGNNAVNGGAVYITGGIQVSLSASTFTTNQATTYGGAIYNASTTSTSGKYGLSVTSCIFGGTGTETDPYVYGNKSKQGGAIYCTNIGNMLATDCNFISNKATAYGGALCIANKGSVSFSGGSFTGNGADTSGGAVYIKGKDSSNKVNLVIAGMEFVDNTTNNGTIRNAANSYGTVTLNTCTVAEDQTTLGTVTIKP